MRPVSARVGPRTVLLALIAIVVAPLVVGMVALRRPQWYPVLDLAMTELRLRDVFTSHTPLIGLPGRIGRFPEQGSHPGPMSFYALWPTWKLLGSTSWGMQVGALVLNAVAATTAILIAFRRRGLRLAVAITALLALLMTGYGFSTLAEPWNPYLPLLWWFVTLLAVWSVLEGDTPMLVVAVTSASMAAQTHVPYLGLCLGMGAVAVAGVGMQWRRGDPDARRRIMRWVLVAASLTAVLWSPLLVDQLTKDPGNLTMLWRHFTSPPPEDGPSVGIGKGFELLFRHLDVTDFADAHGGSLGSLATSSGDAGGSVVPGIVVLATWVAAAAIAHRRRHTTLDHLNVVIAGALVLGLFSMSRIFGKVWFYLMLWSWGTAALVLLSVAWTVWLVVDRERLARPVLAVLVALALAGSAQLALEAARADPPAPQLSAGLARIVPATARALDKDDRYLVTWDDTFYIGSQGYGLVSDLERLGFKVGVLDPWRVPVTQHRVVTPDEVAAEVHLAVGGFVERWRSVAAAREIAAGDPRSPAQVREYEALRRSVRAALRATGRSDEVEMVDTNLFGLSIRDDLPPRARRQIERMLELGSPAAVFVMPPGTRLPPEATP